jgi:hypothetical protein
VVFGQQWIAQALLDVLETIAKQHLECVAPIACKFASRWWWFFKLLARGLETFAEEAMMAVVDHGAGAGLGLVDYTMG